MKIKTTKPYLDLEDMEASYDINGTFTKKDKDKAYFSYLEILKNLDIKNVCAIDARFVSEDGWFSIEIVRPLTEEERLTLKKQVEKELDREKKNYYKHITSEAKKLKII